jgi:hypothetical protein
MFVIDYIWIHDIKQCKLRSQTKIIDLLDTEINELTNDHLHLIPLLKRNDIVLKPVYVVKNPFSKNENAYMALCEQFTENTASNNRLHCDLTLTKHYKGEYYFNITQEILINDPKFKVLKMDVDALTTGDYFSQHREFIDEFVHILVSLGIPIDTIYSMNINRWEYKISNTLGTHTADLIWLTRYILYRLSESYPFMVKFSTLSVMINDISNKSKSDRDPYLTISTMISTLHNVRSQQEMEKIKNSKKKDLLKEQLLLKDQILRESEVLQREMEESHEMNDLERRDLEELERLNRLKEHQQYVAQLRYETRLVEDQKIAREEKMKIELMKREEQTEKERLMVLQTEDENNRLKQKRQIQDAELERLRILKMEVDAKKSKKMLHSELSDILNEKTKMNEQMKIAEEAALRDKERVKDRLKQEKDAAEMERLEKMMDTEYNKSKNEEVS